MIKPAATDPVARMLTSLESMGESAASLRRSSLVLSFAAKRLREEADELARAPALFEGPKQRLLEQRDRALGIARDAEETLARITRETGESAVAPSHEQVSA